MSRYICGIGHPMVDITVTVDNEFLKKYQLNANDQRQAKRHKGHFDIYNEIVNLNPITYTPGGSCFNTLYAAAAFLNSQPAYCNDQKRQRCLFTGSVANDAFAKRMYERASILDLSLPEISGGDIRALSIDERMEASQMMDSNNNLSTAVCAVLLTNGGVDRSLVTNLGAAKIFTRKALESVKPDLLDCKVLYCSGFFLNTFGGPETVIEIGKSLAPTQIMATNLSAPFLAFVKKAELDMCIGYSSFVIGNVEEATAWASAHGFNDLSVDEIATKFAEVTPLRRNVAEGEKSVWKTATDGNVSRVAIITQGSDDIVVAICRISELGAAGEGLHQATTTTEIRRYQTLKVEKVVDTNCAGDTFAGAFIAALSLGKSIDQCIKAGNYAASIVIQDHGCKLPTTCGFSFDDE